VTLTAHEPALVSRLSRCGGIQSQRGVVNPLPKNPPRPSLTRCKSCWR